MDLTIFGSNLNNDTIIKFTRSSESCSLSEVDLIGGGPVTLLGQEEVNSTSSSEAEIVQRASLTVEFSSSSSITLYFCVFGSSEDDQTSAPEHQGSDPWLILEVRPSILPLWSEIIFIIILMVLSGLFSG